MKYLLVFLISFLVLPVFATSNSTEAENSMDKFSDKSMINLTTQKNSTYIAKILDFDGKPTSAIVDEKTNTVYVTDFSAGKLHIIDGNVDEVIDSITVTKTPFGVGINPDTNMIYVGGEYANILSVIDAVTRQVELEIPLEDPYDIAVNPTNNMIYVTSDKTNSVYVIDGATHEMVTSFEVMVPCGIAVNPTTGMVYVTSESENLVHVFDGNDNKVTTIRVEDSPRGVTVNPITNMIYVTNQESNTISVIDGSSNVRVESIQVGEMPRRVVVNSQSNTIYVTNQGSNNVSIIDGSNNEVIETIEVQDPFEIAINSQTSKLYAMHYGGKLSVISYSPKNLPVLDSPFKQISSGIDPYSVTCKEGFELVHKSTDNSPACVKPSTAEKLIQRGWARE